MANPVEMAKLVPGFDFLQGLVKNASAGLPNLGQWIAPTLNPEELSKRIEELRTVQFWLEQNAKLMGTTIQALEVQRMSLATLQQMKVPVAQWAEAFKLKEPMTEANPAAEATAPARKGGGKSSSTKNSARKTHPTGKAGQAKAAAAPATANAAHPMADPMQWWGALTQQFTELASKAAKEGASQAAKAVTAAVVKKAVTGAGKKR